MAWVYLDDQFPDHPKVVAAGDAAAWMFVCGLAYCQRYATAGRIPKGQVPKLTGHRSPAKLAKALVTPPVGYEHGLWEDAGDHYRVHDYDHWNRPQKSRSEAARKAAQKRWAKEAGEPPPDADAYANALPDAYETQCETDAEGDASECPPPLPPVVTFADNSSRPVLPTDDDASAHASSDQHDLGPTVEAALRILAQADLDERQHLEHLDRIGDPTSWLNTAHDRRRASDGARLVELAALDPDAAPEQLVDALTADRPTSAGPVPGGDMVNHTYDDQQRAQLDRASSGLDLVRQVLDVEPPPEAQFRGHLATARDAVNHHAREAEAS